MDDTLFRKIAPHYMRKFVVDFGMTDLDAAAVFGNAGHESAGFTQLQEINPRAGRGGLGWFQWTGPRRRNYEAYCKRHRYDPRAHESNYKFLFVELKGSEKKALAALKARQTLNTKTKAFENAFERAGVKHYASRYKWAAIALDALKKEQGDFPIPPAPQPPAPKPQGPWPAIIGILIAVGAFVAKMLGLI